MVRFCNLSTTINTHMAETEATILLDPKSLTMLCSTSKSARMLFWKEMALLKDKGSNGGSENFWAKISIKDHSWFTFIFQHSLKSMMFWSGTHLIIMLFLMTANSSAWKVLKFSWIFGVNFLFISFLELILSISTSDNTL